MTTFLLVRHGQTVWHSDGVERAEGRAEVDLDPVGIRQAKATAARLSKWQISAVYSSPLKRAMSTAEILSRPGIPVQVEPGLIDIDYGRWQGMTHEEARANDGRLYDTWLKRPHQVTFPDGENLADVRRRCTGAIEALAARHDGKNVLLVSHKTVIKLVLCHVLGLDDTYFWRFQQNMCAVNIIEMGASGAVLYVVNDGCHLRPETRK